MNEVLVSAIALGTPEDFGDSNGVSFTTVVTSQGAGGASHSDELKCIAFGATAQLIKSKVKSGDRVIFSGRIDRDRLGGEKFHSVIVASSLLGVTDAADGVDLATATVAGPSEIKEYKTIGGRNTPLLPFTVISTRKFRDNEYRSYISCSAWSENAEALKVHQQTEGKNLVAQGLIKSRTYEDRDGDSINAIDIWVNSVVILGEGELTQQTSGAGGTYVDGSDLPPTVTTQRRASLEDELPF